MLTKDNQDLTDQEISNVLKNLKLSSAEKSVDNIEEVKHKAILLSDGSYTDSVTNAIIYVFELHQNADE